MKLNTVKVFFNPFNLNGICHYYQVGQSILVLRAAGWYFFPNFNKTFFIRKQWRDAASAVSDLGLHCLPMSHRKEARII